MTRSPSCIELARMIVFLPLLICTPFVFGGLVDAVGVNALSDDQRHNADEEGKDSGVMHVYLTFIGLASMMMGSRCLF